MTDAIHKSTMGFWGPAMTPPCLGAWTILGFFGLFVWKISKIKLHVQKKYFVF